MACVSKLCVVEDVAVQIQQQQQEIQHATLTYKFLGMLGCPRAHILHGPGLVLFPVSCTPRCAESLPCGIALHEIHERCCKIELLWHYFILCTMSMYHEEKAINVFYTTLHKTGYCETDGSSFNPA